MDALQPYSHVHEGRPMARWHCFGRSSVHFGTGGRIRYPAASSIWNALSGRRSRYLSFIDVAFNSPCPIGHSSPNHEIRAGMTSASSLGPRRHCRLEPTPLYGPFAGDCDTRISNLKSVIIPLHERPNPACKILLPINSGLTRGKPDYIVCENSEVVRNLTCVHSTYPLRSAVLDGFEIINHGERTRPGGAATHRGGLFQKKSQHFTHEEVRINIHGYVLLTGKGNDATVRQR